MWIRKAQGTTQAGGAHGLLEVCALAGEDRPAPAHRSGTRAEPGQVEMLGC